MRTASSAVVLGAGARRPRVRRWLTVVFGTTVVGVGLVVGFVEWSLRGSAEAWRLYRESKEWAEATLPRFRALSGGEHMTVDVPIRELSLQAPSFYLSVRGVVLDDATYARLRTAFEAAGPPSGVRVSWTMWNCHGDEGVYKELTRGTP